MKIEYKDITAAIKAKLLTDKQAEKLWEFWQSQRRDIPTFRFTHILYYLGGMIAIAAITIYVTTAWENIKGYPLLIIALLLFVAGIALTQYFLNNRLRIPAGIMATFSLAIVPLIVYNIQFLLGMKPPNSLEYVDFHYWANWYWVNMECTTIIVGLIMFYFYRFPFLLFPVSVVLWYMSMDLWPIFTQIGIYDFAAQAKFSMYFGLLVLVIALIVDLNTDDEQNDYAFWLYIAGVMSFWGGLSCQYSESELSKFFYCVINVIMLLIGAILNRRVFAIFAVLGILAYIAHLAFAVFIDSLGFPLVLILIGILIIFAGMFFSRMENQLKHLMRPFIPAKILKKMR